MPDSSSSSKLSRTIEIGSLIAFALFVAHRLITAGSPGEQPALIVSALLFTAFGLIHGAHMLGWRRTLAFFSITSVGSWIAESHSISSGNVGDYLYTDVLGPKLGEVPYVIPLTWFLMLYPAYVIANLVVTRTPALVRSGWGQILWLSALTAVVMTAWDLTLDPYMSGVVGAWKWLDGGPYFGVPFANYYGWVQVSFLIILAYRIAERYIRLEPMGKTGKWVAALPVGIYAINMIGDLFIGDPIATRLIAPFAMGIAVLAACARLFIGAPIDTDPQPPTTRSNVARVVLGIGIALGLVLFAFQLSPALRNIRVPFTQLVPIFAAFSLVHAIYVLGWKRAGAFVAVAAPLSLLSELLGTKSGLIFGKYYYTDVLGYKFFGEVPWVIPCTWFLMMYPSYLIANFISFGKPTRPSGADVPIGITAFVSFLSAMIMTAWDLTLDPYMVGFDKAWVWEDGGQYFGIPFHNYIGWVGTVFVVMMIYRTIEKRIDWQPLGKLSRPLLLLPLLTYAFMSIGDVVLGHPPATMVISPFVMGIPFLFALSILWQWKAAD